MVKQKSGVFRVRFIWIQKCLSAASHFFKEVPVHRALQLVIDHGSPVVEAKGWREKTATPQVCWWIKVHEGVAKDSVFCRL